MIFGLYNLLAQTTTTTQAADEALRQVGYEFPSQQEILQSIQQMGVWQGALLVAVGVVYLLQGWRIFKLLVIVNAAAIGVWAGYELGAMHSQDWTIYGAIVGAVVLAILAWPLMRVAIGLMGALAGGFAGYQVWRYVATLADPQYLQYSVVGAIVGGLLLGLLAFKVFRVVVMIFTSLQGSLLGVSGVLAMAFQHERFREMIFDPLQADPHLLPLLVLVPAAIGFAVQALGGLRQEKAAPAKAD